MKIKLGVNPDYADYDEIDDDAIGAETAYREGLLTFDELVALIGINDAKVLQEKKFGQELEDPDVGTFDDLDEWLTNEPFC